MNSCWTCGNPFHSYENCPKEIASRKERVPKTYDYRSQYDAYEYDTYHANYNIEMKDDTMYRGEYGAQYFHLSSYETPSFFNQSQRPTQEYYYQGQRQSDDLSFDEKYDNIMSMIESNKEENQRYEASFAAHEASFVALETHEPILLPIDDIRSKEDEEFLVLSLYEDECSNSLEEEQYPNEVEAEVTHIQNLPQLPRVAINQVGEDDSVFKNKKEQKKVSLVKDVHHVVERSSMDSYWTCGNPFHSYENCPEEIASRKERVPKTYDYRSQYDAYEYDTYHANYNIEMEDDTMYRGEYGA
nr:hypothetical protein [Tanacetum cinerariifolium]